MILFWVIAFQVSNFPLPSLCVYLKMQKEERPSLKRDIGPIALGLNAVNLSIGAGIFVLPGLVAAGLGAAGFVAYLLCGLLIILIMLCFAEAGSKITRTGGAYAYVEAAFGPLAGFLTNSLFWFGFSSLADAAVINVLVELLANWLPMFHNRIWQICFFVVVYTIISVINIRGVKNGAALSVATSLLKIVPLFLLVVLGLSHIDKANFSISAWPTGAQLGDTALILFFAFMGMETALNNGGEIKQPQKNIPRGILIGVTTVLIIYLCVHFVAQGVLGAALAQHQDAPLAAVATEIAGPVGSTIIMFVTMLSIFGLLSGDVLATPRILYAAAKDRLLPSMLAKVHPRFATPHIAIIFYSFVGVLFASTGTFRQLAGLASSSVLLIYLAVVLSVIKLRYIARALPAGFRIPGGLLVPILSIVIICWFLLQISLGELKALVIFFLVTSTFYFLVKVYQLRQAKAPSARPNVFFPSRKR